MPEKSQRNLQDESVFEKFNGTSLVQGCFSRISPRGKEPQEIFKRLTLGPKGGPTRRTTKLAMYPTSSSNGTVFEEKLMLAHNKSSKKDSLSLI